MAMLSHSPYSSLEPRAFWRSAVGEVHATTLHDLYRRKFDIDATDEIATAGSCFAQHIGRRLRARHYNVLDVEPAPYAIATPDMQRLGFGLFSARYGNIYTCRQLRQLIEEAFGIREPADPVWTRDGRYFDALRPAVEPEGLPSPDRVRAHRRQHLRHVRLLFERATLVVFTLGLTETWESRIDGTVYPTAPGTVAGSFDPDLYTFRNLSYEENLADLLEVRNLLRAIMPSVRFLLTVSPVPLTATASGHHVLSATTYSKSVLRAVAGAMADRFEDVDYFPSFEIISGIQARGMFYEPNLRSVSSFGVDLVMEAFFAEHVSVAPPVAGATIDRPGSVAGDVVFCEDLLLEAFAR